MTPSSRALWRAFAWAPAVAPLAFLMLFFIVAVVGQALGRDVNEPSLILFPTLALTVGIGLSYVMAGIVGMPIAFFLRRHRILSGYSIHVAALCFGLLFSTVLAMATVGDNWDSLPIWTCYVGAGVIPPVLLSATAFWLLVRKYSRIEANSTAPASESASSDRPVSPGT